MTDNLFFLFCWAEYDPFGGAEDYEGNYPTLEKAWIAFKKAKRVDCANLAVLDNGNLKLFAQSETFTRYLENGNRVTEAGWRTETEKKFIRMEAKEQRPKLLAMGYDKSEYIVTGVSMPQWEDV